MTTGIGVIGAGILGDLHARAVSRHPAARLVGVCDPDADRARSVATANGAKAIYPTHDEMLDDPDVDAVTIATPDFAHRDIAVAAARRGKHIFCEKPLAMTVPEAEEICAAARESEVHLVVDFHNRVNPPVVQARDAIARGAIGTPRYAYARLSNTTFVALEMLSWADRTSALWFLGSHTVDTLRWLMQDDVASVYTVERSGVLRDLGVDTSDVHVSIAEFASGAVATFENSWILPQSEPVVFDFQLDIQGDSGTVRLNMSHHAGAVLHSGGSMSYLDLTGVTPTSPRRAGGFMLEAISSFVDTVAYGDPPIATGEDGLAVTRILAAMERSAATGERVEVTGPAAASDRG